MCESWLNDDNYAELEETVIELMDEYMDSHTLSLSISSFPTTMIQDLCSLLFDDLVSGGICGDSDDDFETIHEIVDNTFKLYWKQYNTMPLRQQSFTDFEAADLSLVASKIMQIEAVPKQQQRSKEWYETRYNMITASSISKALGSAAQVNSLICEKCKPLVMYSCDYVNCDSPLHWGVKYEPITAMIYEHMYNTCVATEFGCIPHRDYPFIGASPDGIVVDPNNERYGHMVEIKNIVNRDITGIPKDEYWIQMQVQLEVCDLEYCDFIETRIKEYEDADETFYDDIACQYRGIILHFVDSNALDPRSAPPHYVYMPLSIPIDRSAIDIWTQNIIDKKTDKYVLYKTHYWYLDEISCIVVKRNREWFYVAIPQFTNVWHTILKERVDGYEHRVPKKRVDKPFALIKLDENGNVV